MAKYKSAQHHNRVIFNLALVAMFAVGSVVGLNLITNPKALNFAGAWDCSKYTFGVTQQGVVGVINTSSRNEPAQKADVYINNVKVATFDVPALTAYGSAPTILGTVTVPSGAFTWKVDGTRDCLNQGQYAAPVNCDFVEVKVQ